MADDYMEVVTFRPRKTGKPYAVRIGSAKANGKGGMNVWLDALPLPDAEGKVSMLISPRLERDKPVTKAAPRRDDDFDTDSIPF